MLRTRDPCGGTEALSYDPEQPTARIPRMLLRAARTCARPTTAGDTGQQHGIRR